MKRPKATVKPIKALNVPTFPAPEPEKSEKNDTIGLILDNKAVADYNEAAAQEKAWAQIKEDCRPGVRDHALAALYEHNSQAPIPVKTVAVQDSTGAACNVSMQDRYSVVDPAAASKGLEMLGKKDPNMFVQEKLTLGFNTAAFWDAEGNFRTAFYLAMVTAIRKVAEEHNCPNPFSSGKITVVKDGFAEERWKHFTAEQQPQVSVLFPTTITLTPVAPKKGEGVGEG